jgi:hypothetical protein
MNDTYDELKQTRDRLRGPRPSSRRHHKDTHVYYEQPAADYTSYTREELQQAAQQALHRSEVARRKAKIRYAQIRAQVEHQMMGQAISRQFWLDRLLRRPIRVPDRFVDAAAQQVASQDPHWKAYVADERWYAAQSVEYSSNALLRGH